MYFVTAVVNDKRARVGRTASDLENEYAVQLLFLRCILFVHKQSNKYECTHYFKTNKNFRTSDKVEPTRCCKCFMVKRLW
jgi:hypothetical protein